MLGQRPVVNEITGLFCHVDEPLRFLLQRLFHLLMTAVSKGVELLAGVARVYRVVGTVGMNGQGAGTDIAYVLRINRSEEHTSELQSRLHLVCRLLLEKKKKTTKKKKKKIKTKTKTKNGLKQIKSSTS